MKISLIKLLLFITFLKGMIWASIVPIWHFPDEQAHFAQVNFFAQELKMPQGLDFDLSKEIQISESLLGTSRDERGNNKFTYHPEFRIDYANLKVGKFENEIAKLPQSYKSEFVKREATRNPFLYYFLAHPFYWLIGDQSLFARVISVRFLSIILATLTIFVVYKASVLIFPKQKIFQLALPTLVSFQPMFTFSTSGVLPDSLVILLFTIFIYLSLLILKNGWTLTKIGGLMIVLIAGFFTRQNFPIILIFLPFVLLATLIKSNQRTKFLLAAMTAFAGLFITSFFVPVLRPIHTFEFPEVATKTINNISFLTHLKFSVSQTIAQTIPWYWGVFNWLGVVLPRLANRVINRLLVLVLIGVLIHLFLIVRKRKIGFEGIVFFYLMFVPVAYFAVLIGWDYLFVRTHGYSFGIQGRYFLPVIVAQMYLVIMGISTFGWRGVKQWLIFLTGVAMIALNMVALFTVSKAYFAADNFKTFFLQASQYKPLFFKSPNLEILLIVYLTSVLIFIIGFFNLALRSRQDE